MLPAPSAWRAGARPWAAAMSLACLAAVAPAAAAEQGASPGPVLSARASTRELPLGGSLSVTGSVGATSAPARVLLQSSPYPFRAFRTTAESESGGDGSFRFDAIRPDRNTRLRVVLESSPAVASPTIPVTVDPVVALHAHSLGPGRVRLSMRLVHAREGGSGPVGASWFLAANHSSLFTLAAVSPTRELAPGVTYASAIVDPPSRRFTFRVCLNPPWEHAMGPAATHGRCPRTNFRLEGNAR